MHIFMEYVYSLGFFVFVTIYWSLPVIGNETISVHEFRILQEKFQDMVSRLEKSENRNAYLANQLEFQNTKSEDNYRTLTKQLNTLTINCNCTNHHSAHKRLLLAPTSQATIYRPPAFSSRLSHGLSGLGNHQTIIFDKVITDTSSAYNSKDGIFVTPQTGMYVFTWTTAVAMKSYIGTELVVDDVMYGYAYADSANDGDDDYGSASQTVVIKVNKGQHVWIRRDAGTGSIDGRVKDTTFSGWLLYPME